MVKFGALKVINSLFSEVVLNDYGQYRDDCAKIDITFESFADEEDEITFTLTADNRSGFKLGERMYKINEKVSPGLNEEDSLFF